MNPPDLLSVYTDRDGADTAAREMRDDRANYAHVAVVERTVRAFGASSTVYVVCAWLARKGTPP